MAPTQWRCRFCNVRNPAGAGLCGCCGQAYIPNLRQLLYQGSAQPTFTPLFHSGAWKGGKPGGKGGKSGAFQVGKGGQAAGKGQVFGQPAAASMHAAGGQGNSAWRMGRGQKKAERDAALAASLLSGEVSESDGDGPSPAVLLGAARHHHRLSQEVSFCPEAKAALDARSKHLFQQALFAKPLPEQVASLERDYQAKAAESAKLQGQLETLQSRMMMVDQEGLAIEKQLAEARARLGAAGPCPSVAPQEPAISSAIGQVEQIASFLAPEAVDPFMQCLQLLKNFVAAEAAAPSTAATSDPYAQVASGGPPTRAGPSVSVASPVGSACGATPGPVTQVLRGRARPRADSSERGAANVDVGGDFIPVRSRSTPGARVRGKTSPQVLQELSSASMNAAHQAFMDQEGARYFSHRAERAGLAA